MVCVVFTSNCPFYPTTTAGGTSWSTNIYIYATHTKHVEQPGQSLKEQGLIRIKDQETTVKNIRNSRRIEARQNENNERKQEVSGSRQLQQFAVRVLVAYT